MIPYPALGVLAVNESILKPAVGRSREPLASAPQRNKRVPQDAAAVRFSIHQTQLFQTPMSGPLARNTNCKEARLASR